MTIDPVDFASLLCSRLCHDLLSPIGALNNGLTANEVREVFLQGTVYCGFPAAMTGLRLMKEVVDETGASARGAEPSRE